MTSELDPAAKDAAASGLLLCRLEGKRLQIDEYHTGYLRFWIFLTRDGRLVVTTRWRLYSIPSGHSAPSAPAQTAFVTEEKLRAMLAVQGLDLPPLRFFNVAGDPSDQLRAIFAKPLAEWSAAELHLAVPFLFTVYRPA